MDITQVMTDSKGYLDKDQIEKLIESADNQRNKLLLKLLWDTGARISELLQLEVDDIELTYKRVTLPNLKHKGNITKQVPITKTTTEMLRDYVKSMSEGRLFNISRSQAFRIVKEAGKKAGFKKIGKKKTWLHPHHFRHSLAIHLVKNGMPIAKVQEILGHSNISSTGFYLRFGQREVEEDYHKIMG